MATYNLTKTIAENEEAKYTFTGEAAATALADFTGWIPSANFDYIEVTSKVVKAGTTDTATITLQGSNDGGTTVYSLADASPNDATNTSASTAGTHTLAAQYVFGGKNSSYATPRYELYRVAYTTSGTTDNKNITNGVVRLGKF